MLQRDLYWQGHIVIQVIFHFASFFIYYYAPQRKVERHINLPMSTPFVRPASFFYSFWSKNFIFWRVFDQDFNQKFTKGHNVELGIFFLDIGYVCVHVVTKKCLTNTMLGLQFWGQGRFQHNPELCCGLRILLLGFCCCFMGVFSDFLII